MAEEPSEIPRNLPRHVAIVMDGNGRWARSRGLERNEGHRAGAEALRTVAECCARWDVDYLTVYAFSTENWQRPKHEVNFLMRELRRFLQQQRSELLEDNIRLRAIGRIPQLPDGVQKELKRTEDATRDCTALNLTLALNYGARAELVDACRALAREAQNGAMSPDQIDEQVLARHLYTADMPDPDLLIRTAGEMRLSNFLLWQLSYTEIYVTDVTWPDFGREHLLEALRAYAGRRRRFGRVEQDEPSGARKACGE